MVFVTQVFEMVREHNFSFLVSRRMELDLRDIISALNAMECICILLCCKAYLAKASKRRRPSTIPIAFLEGVSWCNCDQSTAICCMQNYNRSQQYVTDMYTFTGVASLVLDSKRWRFGSGVPRLLAGILLR